MKIRKCLFAMSLATLLNAISVAESAPLESTTGSDIKILVNDNPITKYDIQHRIAFLKLQQRQGDLTKIARQELIDEKLKLLEMKRQGIDITQKQIEDAFNTFSSGHKMAPTELKNVLNETGVTPQHFMDNIMVQMGWVQIVSKQLHSSNIISEQDAAHRMLEHGGVKPRSTEYLLQQIIFVLPKNKHAAFISKKRQQANAFRSRFRNCDTTRQLAQGMIDVTIRDLGYILEPLLPEDWSKDVIATSAGHTTVVHNTDNGVMFLAVCATRIVSDDRVARLVYSIEDTKKKTPDHKAQKLSEDYLKELRKKAHIVNR